MKYEGQLDYSRLHQCFILVMNTKHILIEQGDTLEIKESDSKVIGTIKLVDKEWYLSGYEKDLKNHIGSEVYLRID